MSDTAPAMARPSLAMRLWRYQRERFPLVAYVPLIGVSAVSAAAWTAASYRDARLPPLPVLLVGAGTGIVFFFLLRVADEHKDAEADRRSRPELPVPRGLVTLAELRRVGAALALLAVLANGLVAPKLLLVLLPAAAWAALMAREFFVPEWLRARPAAYLLSHMVVMPLLFLYLTALTWLVVGGDLADGFLVGHTEHTRYTPRTGPPPALPVFLAVAFLNGVLVEVGRKIRAPRDERDGVDTYTQSWGRRAAPAVWLASLALAAVLAVFAAKAAYTGGAVRPLIAVLAGAAALPAILFLRRPTSSSAKGIEAASGVWTLASYLVLGFAPYGIPA